MSAIIRRARGGNSKRLVALVAGVAVVVATVGVASAHILSSTGSVVYLSSPPASVKLNALESATQVQAFDERQGVTLASALTVDALVTPSTAFPWKVTTFPNGNATIPAGSVVESHLIHSDIPTRNFTAHRTGTVTFSNDIVGVVASTNRLAASDAPLGAPGTQYAGTTTYRGLEGLGSESNYYSDSFTITGKRTLSFDLQTYVMDEIRVITKHDQAPTPVADNYSTNKGVTLTRNAAQGVLSNDSDPDGDTLTASLASGPSHGSLTLNSDGSFTYTPAASFTGDDAFTYNASDGTLSASATATIHVNAPPTAGADTFSTLVNTPYSGTLAGDVTDDGPAPLTFAVSTTPAHGSVTVNADGSFTYTPADLYLGGDSFQYTATDGAGATSNPATVNATVTPPALQTTISDTPDPVTAGDNVQYTVTVTNTDSVPSPNASVVDTLPAGTSLVSEPANCSAPDLSGAITCQLGTLAGGAFATVQLVVNLPTTGTVTDTATAFPGTNPTASEDTAVVSPPPGGASGFVPPGGEITTEPNGSGDTATIGLPGTGAGATVTITNNGAGNFCNGPCTGAVTDISPFAGYSDPNNPITLTQQYVFGPGNFPPGYPDALTAAAAAYGASLYKHADTDPPGVGTLIPACPPSPSSAADFPCVQSRTIQEPTLGNYVVTYVIAYLSGDPIVGHH